MREASMDRGNLYFIALVPHLELREEIREMKEEMKARFNAQHALKSPAHITLQMPFKRLPKDESAIIRGLDQFASLQKPFLIELSGFGCFSPRVIFVNVKDNKLISGLHAELTKALVGQMGFEPDEVMPEVHPHMTLATRDLDKAAFKEAWPQFERRAFSASFEVKSIFLLKHNGNHWDIFGEYLFGRDE